MGLSEREKRLFADIEIHYDNEVASEYPRAEHVRTPPWHGWIAKRGVERRMHTPDGHGAHERRLSRRTRIAAYITIGAVTLAGISGIVTSASSGKRPAAVAGSEAPSMADRLRAQKLGLTSSAALLATGTCIEELAVMRDKLAHDAPQVTKDAYPSADTYTQALADLRALPHTTSFSCLPPAGTLGTYNMQLAGGVDVQLTSDSLVMPRFNVANLCGNGPQLPQAQVEMGQFAPGSPEYTDFQNLFAAAARAC
jgi:hypothetical protein